MPPDEWGHEWVVGLAFSMLQKVSPEVPLVWVTAREQVLAKGSCSGRRWSEPTWPWAGSGDSRATGRVGVPGLRAGFWGFFQGHFSLAPAQIRSVKSPL